MLWDAWFHFKHSLYFLHIDFWYFFLGFALISLITTISWEFRIFEIFEFISNNFNNLFAIFIKTTYNNVIFVMKMWRYSIFYICFTLQKNQLGKTIYNRSPCSYCAFPSRFIFRRHGAFLWRKRRRKASSSSLNYLHIHD